MATVSQQLNSNRRRAELTCAVCSSRLPVFVPELHEEGRLWECCGCKAVYYGVLNANSSRELLRRVRETKAGKLGDSLSDYRRAFIRDVLRPSGTERSVRPDRGGVKSSVETALSRQLDRLADQPRLLRHQSRGPSFLENVNQRSGATPYSPSLQRQMIAGFKRSGVELDAMLDAISGGTRFGFDVLPMITQTTLLTAVDDLDLFVCLGINPLQDKTVCRHSLHVAMLAMAIATNMGLDQESILDLGIGCLLHDIGMRRVKGIHESPSELSVEEFAEVARHPVYTFELLEPHLDMVPLASRMVAYQMHERCNGSGYPRGRSGDQIHDLAKIAAVADVYVALVSKRPHRSGMMPYYAIEHLLYGIKEGQYESIVVRALLHTVSLFPVGSYVSLSDGRVAKVLRTNRELYDRPTVEAYGAGAIAKIIDLARAQSLKIVAPVSGLMD